MRFSSSMLSSWMSCQQKAAFKYVDKLPDKQNAAATFGSCVHIALEEYNQGATLEECIDKFQFLWENPESVGLEPEIWPKRMTYGGLREEGIKILKEYDEATVWNNRTVIATEHAFEVPFGDHTLSGIVDLLEFKKGQPQRLRIIDYKTSSRQPTMDNLYLNTQMTCYYLASMQPEFWESLPHGEKLFKQFTDREVIWHHLRKMKELKAGPRDDQDFMRLYRCCQSIERALKYEVYVPDISGDTCGICPYTNECYAYIPPRSTTTEQTVELQTGKFT